MAENKRNDAAFFMWYGLVEGTALLLAILAYFFVHDNIGYLIGSVVLIALVGSTFLMPRVLMTPRGKSDETSDS